MPANVSITQLTANPYSESDISINPRNPAQIIAASNQNITLDQAEYFSGDGGASWSQSSLPLTGGDNFTVDPAVGWTSDGTAWALTNGVNTTTGAVVVRSYNPRRTPELVVRFPGFGYPNGYGQAQPVGRSLPVAVQGRYVCDMAPRCRRIGLARKGRVNLADFSASERRRNDVHRGREWRRQDKLERGCLRVLARRRRADIASGEVDKRREHRSTH